MEDPHFWEADLVNQSDFIEGAIRIFEDVCIDIGT